jgi:hypothetical protein
MVANLTTVVVPVCTFSLLLPFFLKFGGQPQSR